MLAGALHRRAISISTVRDEKFHTSNSIKYRSAPERGQNLASDFILAVHFPLPPYPLEDQRIPRRSRSRF